MYLIWSFHLSKTPSSFGCDRAGLSYFLNHWILPTHFFKTLLKSLINLAVNPLSIRTGKSNLMSFIFQIVCHDSDYKPTHVPDPSVFLILNPAQVSCATHKLDSQPHNPLALWISGSHQGPMSEIDVEPLKG